ncbi:hypothetical protein BBP40_001354 [Aspergillus hancockii]|nr:hypothetical protein BBP40_001354 [Aspergillus hancockii]
MAWLTLICETNGEKEHPLLENTSETKSHPPPPPTPIDRQERSHSGSQPASRSIHGPHRSVSGRVVDLQRLAIKDHWAYWVRSHADPNIGVQIHATGDVGNGFVFETKRSYSFHDETSERPTTRIPLQWVDGKHFEEQAMLNFGELRLHNAPVCAFEASAYMVRALEKSLNAVDDPVRFLLVLALASVPLGELM